MICNNFLFFTENFKLFINNYNYKTLSKPKTLFYRTYFLFLRHEKSTQSYLVILNTNLQMFFKSQHFFGKSVLRNRSTLFQYQLTEQVPSQMFQSFYWNLRFKAVYVKIESILMYYNLFHQPKQNLFNVFFLVFAKLVLKKGFYAYSHVFQEEASTHLIDLFNFLTQTLVFQNQEFFVETKQLLFKISTWISNYNIFKIFTPTLHHVQALSKYLGLFQPHSAWVIRFFQVVSIEGVFDFHYLLPSFIEIQKWVRSASPQPWLPLIFKVLFLLLHVLQILNFFVF